MKADSTNVVPVSLITTVLNEESSIGFFLSSLEKQTVLPREFIIVDGGSTDQTVNLLKAWSSPPGMQVRVIESVGANISEGRNAAISVAESELVAVTDAGTEPHPNWLEELTAGFDTGADIVSGFFECRGRSFRQRLIGSVITPSLSEINPDTFLPSSRSVAFRKSSWASVGGYPEWLDYCEDLVYDMALKSAGLTFSFAPSAVVTWDARPTFTSFAKQYYRYARGDGKAGLWTKRHVARYVAYAAGALSLAVLPLSPWPLVVAVPFGVAYLSKFWGRVIRSRSTFGGQFVLAFIAVPGVVVLGDIAKMIGYPAGIRWRSQAGHPIGGDKVAQNTHTTHP